MVIADDYLKGSQEFVKPPSIIWKVMTWKDHRFQYEWGQVVK